MKIFTDKLVKVIYCPKCIRHHYTCRWRKSIKRRKLTCWLTRTWKTTMIGLSLMKLCKWLFYVLSTFQVTDPRCLKWLGCLKEMVLQRNGKPHRELNQQEVEEMNSPLQSATLISLMILHYLHKQWNFLGQDDILSHFVWYLSWWRAKES